MHTIPLANTACCLTDAWKTRRR